MMERETDRAQPGAPRRRLGLFPVAVAVVLTMLSVRVGALWQDVSITAGAPTAAQVSAEAASTSVEPAAASTESPRSPEILADPLSMTDEEIGVLQSLAARRQVLDGREAKIAEREALLTAAEQRIDAKIAELKALQEAVRGSLVQYDAERDEQIKSLVKIYETMKPKDAATIFNQLELDTLLPVVDRMKEQKAAQVLAQMDPVRVRELTLELVKLGKMPIPQ
jgi:flagellar motility protein MotE (MotC chaperone)